MSEARSLDAAAARRATRRGWWIAIAAMVIAFVLDQVTKIAVRDSIVQGEEIDLLPGVHLVHTTNRGIAFGLLPGHQTLVAVLTALALCVIGATLMVLAERTPAVMLGGGLLLGGAVGNLVDRLAHGGVTDFIGITSRWPPFNVADIAIVVGAVLAATGLVGGQRSDP